MTPLRLRMIEDMRIREGWIATSSRRATRLKTLFLSGVIER